MLGKHNLGLTRSSWIHIGWQWIQFQLANTSRSGWGMWCKNGTAARGYTCGKRVKTESFIRVCAETAFTDARSVLGSHQLRHQNVSCASINQTLITNNFYIKELQHFCTKLFNCCDISWFGLLKSTSQDGQKVSSTCGLTHWIESERWPPCGSLPNINRSQLIVLDTPVALVSKETMMQALHYLTITN
jgi:hypothetical protein